MNLDFHLDKKREIYLTIQDNIREMSKHILISDKIIKEVQNGGQVVAIQDSGPIIRDWQNKSLTWNLTYPKGSVEECISWMANRDC
ncbi:BnaC05g08150D [Brassica napus]|uniref:BnaC05g08150D protein n=1 Tax=Brassica napus TaxID=3708 RepID=A0A078HKV2_BRANA|nr:BnaC05g08150D [Brassica napus]